MRIKRTAQISTLVIAAVVALFAGSARAGVITCGTTEDSCGMANVHIGESASEIRHVLGRPSHSKELRNGNSYALLYSYRHLGLTVLFLGSKQVAIRAFAFKTTSSREQTPDGIHVGASVADLRSHNFSCSKLQPLCSMVVGEWAGDGVAVIIFAHLRHGHAVLLELTPGSAGFHF
jgi:hypothetical protein